MFMVLSGLDVIGLVVSGMALATGEVTKAQPSSPAASALPLRIQYLDIVS
jgi:hypothetical protein